MAKFCPDDVMDAALDVIALADEMYVCSDQPANYAGIAAVLLVGPIALTPGDGAGDFTIGDGLVSGRRLTVAAQNSATIVNSGDADHVVLATGGATDLLRYVTTCTLQALVATQTVNIPSFGIELRDPTA